MKRFSFLAGSPWKRIFLRLVVAVLPAICLFLSSGHIWVGGNRYFVSSDEPDFRHVSVSKLRSFSHPYCEVVNGIIVLTNMQYIRPMTFEDGVNVCMVSVFDGTIGFDSGSVDLSQPPNLKVELEQKGAAIAFVSAVIAHVIALDMPEEIALHFEERNGVIRTEPVEIAVVNAKEHLLRCGFSEVNLKMRFCFVIGFPNDSQFPNRLKI